MLISSVVVNPAAYVVIGDEGRETLIEYSERSNTMICMHISYILFYMQVIISGVELYGRILNI